MRSGTASRDELVAQPAGEREVSDPVTVQMPEFPAAEAKFDAAEAMRADPDAGPRRHGGGDPLRGAALPVGHQLTSTFDPVIQGRPEPTRSPRVISPRTSAATVRAVARFNLQFDVQQVGAYAARYPDENDALVLAIGREARRRGHYTREEFVAACRWKTPRSGPLVATNTAGEIETATRIARQRREHGTRTHGCAALASRRRVSDSVGAAPSADPERYPILDKRALHALGVRPPGTYNFRFWAEYVEEYRRLLEQARVDGRTLDRRLWHWSSEQGVPLY
jgi:hypothetical protein